MPCLPDDPRIHLDHVLYVHYQFPDLIQASKFFLDFGFHIVPQDDSSRVYYRGFGVDHFLYIAEQSPDKRRHFIAGAWAVESHADLEAASKLSGASAITKMTSPGGGNSVTVTDPVGHTIVLVHGQEKRVPDFGRAPKSLTYNTWNTKRRKGEFQRPGGGPSKVHKLGHYGFEVTADAFPSTLAWYMKTFTLAPTDSLFSPETGKDTMTFIHMDKGEEYVDHHSFFLAVGPQETGFRSHHSSFEVDDFDSELSGHSYLEAQGWTNCFGVGRHILGSQIFDYWFDPNNYVVEHYADGDLVNASTGHSREASVLESVKIWGPNVPLAFLTRQIEDLGKSVGPPPGAGGPGGPRKKLPEKLVKERVISS